MGSLTIQRTSVFEALRKRIARRGNRYRIWIRVVSKVSGTPPRIVTSAVWVRCERKVARTRTKWVKVAIARPYERIVESTGTGTRLLPFDRVKGRTRHPESIRRTIRLIDAAAHRLMNED